MHRVVIEDDLPLCRPVRAHVIGVDVIVGVVLAFVQVHAERDGRLLMAQGEGAVGRLLSAVQSQLGQCTRVDVVECRIGGLQFG